MSYITSADLEQRVGAAAFVQLADDDNDGAADAGVVAEVLAAAEGEVNSHLGARYRVPVDLAQHPELAGLLASMALDLAELRLRARRPPVADEVRARAERAGVWLRAAAGGAVSLPSLAPVAPAAWSGPRSAAAGEPRVLSLEALSDH